MADAPVPPHVRRKELAWAVVRLILGQAQMIGAVAGMYLLVVTGVSEATLAVCAVTGACTLLSRALFRGRPALDVRGRGGPRSP